MQKATVTLQRKKWFHFHAWCPPWFHSCPTLRQNCIGMRKEREILGERVKPSFYIVIVPFLSWNHGDDSIPTGTDVSHTVWVAGGRGRRLEMVKGYLAQKGSESSKIQSFPCNVWRKLFSTVKAWHHKPIQTHLYQTFKSSKRNRLWGKVSNHHYYSLGYFVPTF